MLSLHQNPLETTIETFIWTISPSSPPSIYPRSNETQPHLQSITIHGLPSSPTQAAANHHHLPRLNSNRATNSPLSLNPSIHPPYDLAYVSFSPFFDPKPNFEPSFTIELTSTSQTLNQPPPKTTTDPPYPHQKTQPDQNPSPSPSPHSTLRTKTIANHPSFDPKLTAKMTLVVAFHLPNPKPIGQITKPPLWQIPCLVILFSV